MKRLAVLSLCLLLALSDVASAANRYWVGGTGTWDNSSTTHWSTTSGGSSGASAPGSSDGAIFDANSCTSGPCTITVNANIVLSSAFGQAGITFGACTNTCILDFSANNNTVSANSFNISGTGTRELKMGTGLWTATCTIFCTGFDFETNTNLTFNPAGSQMAIVPSGNNAGTITAGSFNNYTIPSLTINDAASARVSYPLNFRCTGSGGCTISNLTLTSLKRPIQFNLGTAITITNALTFTGTPSAPHFLKGFSDTPTLVTFTGGVSGTWVALEALTFAGGASSITNCLDLGGVSGTVTCTAPSTGGGATGIVRPGIN